MAIAAGEAEVWSIEGRDFRAQLEARPALAVDVVRAYAERVRALRKRVLGLTFKEVPARLADTLLTLVEAHGERCPHGGETDLRGITQQDLADLVGASPLVRLHAHQRDEARRRAGQRGPHPLHPRPEGAAEDRLQGEVVGSRQRLAARSPEPEAPRAPDRPRCRSRAGGVPGPVLRAFVPCAVGALRPSMRAP